jgi:hypothetical protein
VARETRAGGTSSFESGGYFTHDRTIATVIVSS